MSSNLITEHFSAISMEFTIALNFFNPNEKISNPLRLDRPFSFMNDQLP